MANQEQLALLKQGVRWWNRWREDNPRQRIDLRNAILYDANLRSADLSGADLSFADLFAANLRSTDLRGAKLGGADFRDADLSRSNLHDANLVETVFSNIDLSEVKGLAECQHHGPSIIDYRTLSRSGQLPESFLRGIGLPDTFIDYIPSLFNQPLQFYSCFISYSHQDEEFAKRLHADLQDKGVRCWYAPEDLPIGAKIRVDIDQAIRKHDKLLLILSKHSVNSQWVESEVESALEKERQSHKTVLFPIRLDDTVMNSSDGWAGLIKRSRNIGNFCHWKDYDDYQQVFERLLRDLKPSLAEPA
ncbi:toll/interleukin-1 receptor domain-containing protein [Halomicronema sp. CCY15110]|uniref:toll/interleukin-1 receptor domain-containing protein n=1 Tax=Halomicronema sp. CCY15110 TaxID=2767773 RepID=UPI0019500D28|nr:toll/interleukin-1 receptor domain-containing protein [Halomicronema sp. CCY15110]